MNEKNKRKHAGIKTLLLAGVMIGVLTSGQFAFAEEESYATAENILEADPVYVGESITIEEEPVIEFDGTISDAEQICQYTYTAPRDGRYYFAVTNVKQNCSVWFDLYDSLGNNICSSAGNMVQLEESETYTIQIEQRSGNTDFTVQIGQQKPSTDITDITEVNDQVIFKDQKNVYFYTAPRNGEYRFFLSDTTANIKFELMIWDQYGTNIADWVTESPDAAIELEGGVTYEIQVRNVSYSGIGKYTLNVKEQKPVIDITGYTEIHDSLEFMNQVIYYTFVPPVDGEYVFSMTDTKGIYKYLHTVKDDNWNTISESSGYTNADKLITLSLSAGMEYTIIIQPYKYDGLGSYTLKINYPSSAEDYLETAFSDGAAKDSGVYPDGETAMENDSESAEAVTEDTSADDLILQQLESLQSEMDELREENEMLKNALDENEIEYE